jgi:hypothetical protein
MNPKVDAFLKRQDKWRAEFEKLREILLGSGLTEELKWGQPCYALDGKNVALIHGFKEYCAILFHKGASCCAAEERVYSRSCVTTIPSTTWSRTAFARAPVAARLRLSLARRGPRVAPADRVQISRSGAGSGARTDGGGIAGSGADGDDRVGGQHHDAGRRV